MGPSSAEKDCGQNFPKRAQTSCRNGNAGMSVMWRVLDLITRALSIECAYLAKVVDHPHTCAALIPARCEALPLLVLAREGVPLGKQFQRDATKDSNTQENHALTSYHR